MKAAKVLVVVFSVIIVILLAILFFYNPVKAPVVPSQLAPASSSSPSQ